MESRLISYIWRHTRLQQLWILIIVALSMIPYFMSFDLPKQIVNGPIQGEGFETPDATQLFMRLDFNLPWVGEVVLFPGIELTRVSTLFALSFVFLFFVIVNGLFKLYINTYKGRLGERLLRRIRFELIDRILRFPPNAFKRMRGTEISSMVKDEVEPMGGFTGDAFVSPALLGGQAITALVFIFVQNVWLGVITAVLVSVQAIIIPRMRARLLVLGRERQLTARQLAGRVGEIFEGIGAIHSNDTSNYERADISARLGHIFKIRYDIYRWKFMVKFINNSLASFTPFLFYIIGGYLALQGRLDIGQLIAVIAAYKDLPGPLKELIDWDQTRQDVQIKYTQVISQFSVEPMIDPEVQALTYRADRASMKHPLTASNLTLADDSGAKLLERVNIQINPGESVAIVSNSGGGEALAEAFARLQWPESGKVGAGDDDLLALPESVTGRAISYASSDAYFFTGSLYDNLLYGLKNAPPTLDATEERSELRKWLDEESLLAGNSTLDINSDWIDYAAVGASGKQDLLNAVIPVLDSVLFTKDIVDLALRSTVDLTKHPEVAAKIVEMRQALRAELKAQNLTSLIDHFEPGAYNTESTVGENLLFGNATGSSLMPREIGKNAYFRSVIQSNGLDREFYEMGYEIAENAVELFGDLPPDHPFFQQLTFMTADDIPAYQLLLKKLHGLDFNDVSAEDRPKIIRLTFAYVEPRHRFGLLTAERMEKILSARHQFHDGLPADMNEQIEIYDPDRYTSSASLMDNVVFGRVNSKHADGAERLQTVVGKLLDQLDLTEDFITIGLDFEVGTGGKRLTQVQRQKLTLARALLRRSDYYVFNRALTALDSRSREQIIRNVLALKHAGSDGAAIIWVLADVPLSNLFERVAVFDGTVLADVGPYATLVERNNVFQELMAG